MAESDVTALPVLTAGGVSGPFGRRSILGRLARIRLAAFAMVIVTLVTSVAVLAPVITQYDPNELTTFSSETPSTAHWLGTDKIGRDQYSRLVYGARASLMVSAMAATIGVSLGSLLGLIAAYFGGAVDFLIMRTADAMLALPGILMPLLLVSVIGGSIGTVALALGIGLAPGISRLMRGQALSQKQRDYVLAATALGATAPRVMLRHIAPNCMAPIIVATSLGMSFAVIAEAGLSFLGVGVKPPTPTWGGMLSSGLAAIRLYPWQVFAPGTAIFLLVLSFNFLGDALRDVLDPRLRGVV